ncbi:phosphofructokinase domain-containing protein [Thelephora terrestris]|uniref:ATP-dependent 6-phosphofructokinase n=1 Tax=Thelephora terrestris TaxID=56493 RepID=A0A9P6HMZ1_9AGAM|nr:phosphofructokinase domain-containing protein [Thelephora terrestris]
MKIAVLTSGGDSAGMNAVVRGVVRAGIVKGCETWVVREGYEGLVRGNDENVQLPPYDNTTILKDVTIADPEFLNTLRFGDGTLLRDGTFGHNCGRSLRGRYIIRVGWDDVRGYLPQGGTLIGTARSKDFREHSGRLKAAFNLIKEGIDALVICGGDGSLTGADVFRSEWPGLVKELETSGQITEAQATKHGHLKIVGLVGSIDNDMSMTDLTIGAPTALHRICEAIDSISSTAASHKRAFVLEVMGRHCGWLALMAGVAGGADFIMIPEQPPEAGKWQEEMCKAIDSHRVVGKRKTIVIVAEGAHDTSLTPIKAEDVKNVLSEKLNLDTRVTTLGHTQRGGRPCYYDRLLPTLQAVEAVNTLLEATPGTPSYMIGISENKITRVPLMDAVEMTRNVAKAIAEKDFARATSLRDPEFAEALDGFYHTSQLATEPDLPIHKRLRVAFMHVGAPAGGMNAATRAAVRYCLYQGHIPLAIYNGFNGLLDDNVTPLTWLGVDNWMARGGSELGTNRTLPSINIGQVASKFQEHGINALMLIGGFEAFTALVELDEAREAYPALCVPIVHLPATISNNVPVTEYSLGSDTCLNALVDACDAIKQSAVASRSRVFVVETQGGKCGYIATMGALATGACIVYTPEDGINLDMLRQDVKYMKRRYGIDKKGKATGRLIIRNEVASSVYSTEVMTKMFKEEGGTLFDSRMVSLGHTLQGNIPSPIDRTRAVRLSLKSMHFIEEQAEQLAKLPWKQRWTYKGAIAVITIQGTKVKWVRVEEMVEQADMKNRRGKTQWWTKYKQMVEMLVAREQLVN